MSMSNRKRRSQRLEGVRLRNTIINIHPIIKEISLNLLPGPTTWKSGSPRRKPSTSRVFQTSNRAASAPKNTSLPLLKEVRVVTIQFLKNARVMIMC